MGFKFNFVNWVPIGTEEVGHVHVSTFCIYSAHYLPLLPIFNCVL